MTEYHVSFVRADGEHVEESLVVLPSFWKLLWWFLRTARHCNHIMIIKIRT